jgi:N-acetylneuraminic acid mutarotase
MIKQAIFILVVLSACSGKKTEPNPMKIEFEILSQIPPAQGKTTQFGLAGPLVGCDDNHLIVAGGSNFEDNLPWRGGTKSYHDDIYILTRLKNGSNIWSQLKQKLPQPMAYSALVPAGNGFLSIGGEDFHGKLNQVYQISMEGDSIHFESFPKLPVALSNSGATIIGTKVYVAGGLDSNGATNHLMSLDLSLTDLKWESLPNLPESLSHAVVVSQSDGNENCIYVFGGRNQTGITSTFLSTIWKYSPSGNEWINAGSLQLKNKEKFGLSAGTGVAYGDRWIILIGGDKGNLFNKTEILNDKISKAPEGPEKEKIRKEKDIHLISHPGFSREILAFNTFTGELKLIGESPVESQVTTTAFWWNDQIVIPSGEIRPGVRTPLVRSIKIIE